MHFTYITYNARYEHSNREEDSHLNVIFYVGGMGYLCKYCGESLATNYLLGSHVSRKHREEAKEAKKEKIMMVESGQNGEKKKRGRGRPRLQDKHEGKRTKEAMEVPSSTNDGEFQLTLTESAKGIFYHFLTHLLTCFCLLLSEHIMGKLENLHVLRIATQLGLISESQYNAKQNEFLHSFEFIHLPSSSSSPPPANIEHNKE